MAVADAASAAAAAAIMLRYLAATGRLNRQQRFQPLLVLRRPARRTPTGSTAFAVHGTPRALLGHGGAGLLPVPLAWERRHQLLQTMETHATELTLDS